jgi:sigma-E factor negative regulatory protein RseC
MEEIFTDRNCESDSIAHSGIINKLDERYYYVSIIAQKSCSNCYSKGLCSITDLNDQIIEVPRKHNNDRKVGDEVEVLMKKSLGVRAVLLGYILPFVLLLSTLILTYEISESEGLAGAAAIFILIPYYFVLYALKERLKSTFVFSIR